MYLLVVLLLSLFVASLDGQRRPRPFSSSHLKYGPLVLHESGENNTDGRSTETAGISLSTLLLIIASTLCLVCLCAEYVRRARKRHQNRLSGGGGCV